MKLKKDVRTNTEWKKVLTPEQYHILREKGTESPGTCALNSNKEGVFYCVACKNPLFVSEKKFDSGTGWPSFFEPYSKESIILREDNSLFIFYISKRITLVLCRRSQWNR